MDPPDTLELITHGLFDYAGMFPPAALPFEQTLQEAARHPKHLTQPGLVATDMVVKPEHLDRLTDTALQTAGWTPGTTCTIALVGLDLLAAERLQDTLVTFNETHAESPVPRRIVSVEPTTDSRLETDRQDVEDTLAAVHDTLGEAIHVYLEPRWDPTTWQNTHGRLFGLLEELHEGRQVGLKIRCAGKTAVDPDTMIRVLRETTARSLPLKATQGLHHPVIEERWNNEWGFVNLATARCLVDATGTDLPDETIHRLLAETDPRTYSFQGHLRWREHELDPPAVQKSLQRTPLAIGSCSIREPDEDLVRLFA